MHSVSLEPGYGESARVDRTQEPELRLMSAVLKDALEHYARSPHGPGRKAALAREARAWVRDDSDSLFGFRSVCEHLEIDAAALRAALAEREAARVEGSL